MLEIGKQRSLSKKLPPLRPDSLSFERLPSAPAVQLIARDAFVSDIAVKLEGLHQEIKSLGREMELVKSDIAELREETGRNYRFSTFHEKEQRVRAVRVEEMQRRVNDFKTRLDALDLRQDGEFQSYPSLEAISRKLSELSTLEHDFRQVEKKLKFAAALFCGSVLMWLFAIVAL